MAQEGAPTSPILLVDGDIVKHRCAFAAEKTHYAVELQDDDSTFWDRVPDYKSAKEMTEQIGTIWSRKEVQPVEFALQCAKTTMEALVERFRPRGVHVYLSGPGNFREMVAVTKPYKGNRLEAKPKHFNAVGEYLVQQWGAEPVRGIEADDAIGIGLSEPGSIAVSVDKDLNQIAGWHYNWVDGNLYEVSRREADFNLFTQILAGDSTDNVPGLDGVGGVGARRILEGSKTSKELQERAWAAYQDRGYPLTYFLEMAELIYIRREDNDSWIRNLEAALKPA